MQTDEVAARFAAQSIMRLWFEQAIFDSGFMHADLHQGNFKVAILEDGDSLRIFIFDYGMAEVVENDIQRAFILLGAGASFNDPRIIAKALSAIMEGDTIAPKRLRALVKRRINQEMQVYDPENWIKWAALDLQLKLPDQLGTLARGGKLVTQLPQLLGDAKMSKKVAVQLAKKNLWRAITDWRYKYPLKLIDLGQIGFAAVKQKCVQLINRFLRRQ